MNFLKKHWLTLLLCIFVAVLPWQTRFIFDFVPLSGGVSEYGVLSVYVSEVILSLGLIVGYGVFGAPRIRKDNRRPLMLALLLLAFVLIAAAFSISPNVSLFAFLHLAVAMVFFAALLDERAELSVVIAVFAFALVPSVALGVFQVLTGGSPASTILGLALRDAAHLGDSVVVMGNGVRVLRAYGSFPHPNIFGGYLAVAICGVLWFLKRGGVPLLTKEGTKGRWARSAYALLLVLFLGLILTGSRSAILGLALGLGLSMLVTKMKDTGRARRLMVPIAAFVIGFAILLTVVAPAQIAAIRGGGRLEAQSLEERADQYGEYPSVLSIKNALVGSGLGTYVYALAEAHPGEDVTSYQPIHNVPLLIFEEIGLIGAMLIGLWAASIDTMNYARFPNKDAVAAFAMGNVVLVVLFFDHYLWSSWSGLTLIVFVMALTVKMGEHHNSQA